jgi:hypothetical protein
MQEIQTNTNGFFLWVGDAPGRNKITIGTGEEGVHYTLTIKEGKKVIDIHKTLEKKDGKKYEQLFEMSFYSCMRLLALLRKSELQFLHEYWLKGRINIGKLRRHDMVLMKMTEDENVARQFVDLRREKKIRLKKTIAIAAIDSLLLYPEELSTAKESAFWVFSTRKGRFRKQGLLFRHPLDERKRSFFFITNRDFAQYGRRSAKAFYEALSRVSFKNKDNILNYLFDGLSKNLQLKKSA